MIDRVESAIAAPVPGREDGWREDLHRQLSAMGDALAQHIVTTEDAGGLLDEILEAAPRLAHRVERARADHERITAGVVDAQEAVRSASVDDVRDRVVSVLGELIRHRQLGSDLVFEAFNVDIEAAD